VYLANIHSDASWGVGGASNGAGVDTGGIWGLLAEGDECGVKAPHVIHLGRAASSCGFAFRQAFAPCFLPCF